MPESLFIVPEKPAEQFAGFSTMDVIDQEDNK